MLKFDNFKNIEYIDIYFSIYILYMLQGILYPSGSIISRTLILLFLLIGMFDMVHIILRKNSPAIVNVWIIFTLMIIITFIFSDKVIYGVLYEAIGRVNTYKQTQGILGFLLPFFVSYRYVLKKDISINRLNAYTIILLIAFIIDYIYSYSQDLLLTSRESFTVNAGYKFTLLLPYTAFFFKKRKGFILPILLIVTIFIFHSSKRGAIVCLFAAILFIFLYFLFKTKFSFKKLFIILFGVIFFTILISHMYTSNEYLQNRVSSMEEVGIGARQIAYPLLFNAWLNETNIFTLIFGRGMAQSVTVWGNYAHNDWLELLTDNGLLGVGLYLMIFCLLCCYMHKLKIGDDYKLAGFLCILVLFLKTIFSMGYTGLSNLLISFALGIIIGKNELYKRIGTRF